MELTVYNTFINYMFKFLLAPFAWLYTLAIVIRHKMFDWKLLPSVEYDIPIICIGNITVGGTGKTPMAEALIRHLSTEYNVGVLSRGYKRRTRGYYEVEVNSSFLKSGDEPKQMKLKFPNVVVAVCADRREGINKMRLNHPELNLLILDDAFQHRYVEPWTSVLLMDYTRPVYKDHMLPWGRLRDTLGQINRARFIVINKCPNDITAIDMRIVNLNLLLFPYQRLFFTKIKSVAPKAIFEEGESKPVTKGCSVVLMSGVGNPKSFEVEVSKCYVIKEHLVYPDHHTYRKSDIKRLTSALSAYSADTVVLVTEKDYVKLISRKNIPQELFSRLYYLPIELEFLNYEKGDFFSKLDEDVRENTKYSLHH